MAPVRGDGMRGLAVFISDIRNCKLIDKITAMLQPRLADNENKKEIGRGKTVNLNNAKQFNRR